LEGWRFFAYLLDA
jgi:hypothetical protein